MKVNKLIHGDHLEILKAIDSDTSGIDHYIAWLKERVKQMHRISISFLLFAVFCNQQPLNACTSILISKGASADGSSMISYAADSHTRYGSIIHRPAGTYPTGAMLHIYDWGNGKPLGTIPQAFETYSVMGWMNEHQVAFGETTFGGRPELQDTTGVIDYGSLIFIALQRSKSAREAIRVMGELVEQYGFCSTGETFSISDPNEVWIVEMIGKGAPVLDGNGKPVKGWTKGAVWVALRIPDGYVSAHANQARIMQFPLEKRNSFVSIGSKNLNQIFRPEVECVYAHDVISFARLKGYFTGKDEDFSFSDVYAPLDFGAARFCEARVWSVFRKATGSNMDEYIDYAMGKNLKNRMPLWIKPNRKLTLADVKDMMRDHFEGTPMDMTKDIGGGPFNSPYRWRPMTWELNGENYIHERAISTQQTGFSFIAQSRGWLPDVVGGLYWFGVDDTYSTVYTPLYSSGLGAPHCFDHRNGSMCEYSETSAFWLFNNVANYAYSRYRDMIVDIQKVQRELESGFVAQVAVSDKRALEMFQNNEPAERIKVTLTSYSNNATEQTFSRWKQLWHYLMVKYLDGNIKKQDENGRFLESPYSPGRNVSPDTPRYPDWWYEAIIREHGDIIKELIE